MRNGFLTTSKGSATTNSRPEAELYHKKTTDWAITSHLKFRGQFLYTGSADRNPPSAKRSSPRMFRTVPRLLLALPISVIACSNYSLAQSCTAQQHPSFRIEVAPGVAS